MCDDFEGAEPLEGGWSHVGNPANAPVLDTTRAFGGNQSLTFPATDTQGTFVVPTAGLPVNDNRVYVRAYTSFAQPTSAMGGHVSFIVGATQPSNGVEVRFGASANFGNQQMMLDVNFLGAGPEYTQFSNGDITGGAPSNTPGVALEADTWYCLETLFDGSAHELRMWIDGEEVTGLHVTDWGAGLDTWSPEYAYIKIGGQNYSGTLGQVWYDDVAISTEPIGCDEPRSPAPPAPPAPPASKPAT
jgi:hypothetical protein